MDFQERAFLFFTSLSSFSEGKVLLFQKSAGYLNNFFAKLYWNFSLSILYTHYLNSQKHNVKIPRCFWWKMCNHSDNRFFTLASCRDGCDADADEDADFCEGLLAWVQLL